MADIEPSENHKLTESMKTTLKEYTKNQKIQFSFTGNIDDLKIKNVVLQNDICMIHPPVTKDKFIESKTYQNSMGSDAYKKNLFKDYSEDKNILFTFTGDRDNLQLCGIEVEKT